MPNGTTQAPAAGLPLTGERTVPGIERENYWFRRHEAVYDWIVAPGASGTVVEAGCGEGFGAELLRRSGAAVVAVDYDTATIEHVRGTYPQVTAVRANLVSLPLPDNCVDMVVSLQVIEHLWDLAGFLRESLRVLRPGGTLVVSTPNRLTFSAGLGRGERPTNPFHVEEFDAGQLPPLLAAAGFVGIQTHGLFHGPRLIGVERRRGPLVQRQIDAVLTEEWPAALMADVTAVTTADFDIRAVVAETAAGAMDLIGVARKAAS